MVELSGEDYHRRDKLIAELIEGKLALELANIFAAELAQWDNRINKIVSLEHSDENEKLDLVISFDPEPEGDAVGFFWIVNLLQRDAHERFSEQMGITNLVNLGFRIGDEFHFPNGKIIKDRAEKINLWSNDE